MRATITIASLYIITALAFGAPLSSSDFSEYIYKYKAHIISYNDGLTKPTGFKIVARAHFELVYQEPSLVGETNVSSLYRLRLTEPFFYPMVEESFASEPLIINSRNNPDHDIYVHVVTLSNQTTYIKQLYTHSSDSTTFKNLKKSIILHLVDTSHSTKVNQMESNMTSNAQLFYPISKSKQEVVKTSHIDTPTGQIFQNIKGFQNITYGSKLFSQAMSNLSTDFELDMLETQKSANHEQHFENIATFEGALNLLDNYIKDSIELEREPRVCSQRHCRQTLAKLYDFYRHDLKKSILATVESPIASLRLMDTIRDKKSGITEITDLLKKIKRKDDILSSFLDILAAARTEDSIRAALKILNLPKNKNLDVSERFLSALSVSTTTEAKMHQARHLLSIYSNPLRFSIEAKKTRSKKASSEFIAKEFIDMFKKTPPLKWSNHKLCWSSLLTLASLLNSRNLQIEGSKSDDYISHEVCKLLFTELQECVEADCRIVMLQAIGNIGIINDQIFNILKDNVLNHGKRESIWAMKILRDLFSNSQEKSSLAFFKDFQKILIRVVYDASQDTTARILASEMIANFMPDSAALQILDHLPLFANHEMATMIYSRMLALKPELEVFTNTKNWFWKSNIVNGSSAALGNTMAKTDTLNVSYGVNVELINKGKLLKESSFDLFLENQGKKQEIFSLGIFARGLQSFASGNDGTSSDDSESAMVGIDFKLLGGYLRPYIFFNGMTELMSHVWSGTASDPTTIFNGNLLLIDHEEATPLISGFVAEHQMRGVLSIDVAGNIKISLWNRNSHSVVRNKASMAVHASQSVFTSYDKLWLSHLYSFGGEALVDFIADSDFYSTPFKICLQVTQPEFKVRYNSRRHDQMMTAKVKRKLSRQSYSISAKSYSLFSENNKMCQAMKDEL